jgi:hypothetical protein
VTDTKQPPRIWAVGNGWAAADPAATSKLLVRSSRRSLEQELGIADDAATVAATEREQRIEQLRQEIDGIAARLEQPTATYLAAHPIEDERWSELGDAVRAWDDVHGAYGRWSEVRDEVRRSFAQVVALREEVRPHRDLAAHHGVTIPEIVTRQLPAPRHRWRASPPLRMLDAIAAAVDETPPAVAPVPPEPPPT